MQRGPRLCCHDSSSESISLTIRSRWERTANLDDTECTSLRMRSKIRKRSTAALKTEID